MTVQFCRYVDRQLLPFCWPKGQCTQYTQTTSLWDMPLHAAIDLLWPCLYSRVSIQLCTSVSAWWSSPSTSRPSQSRHVLLQAVHQYLKHFCRKNHCKKAPGDWLWDMLLGWSNKWTFRRMGSVTALEVNYNWTTVCLNLSRSFWQLLAP